LPSSGLEVIFYTRHSSVVSFLGVCMICSLDASLPQSLLVFGEVRLSLLTGKGIEMNEYFLDSFRELWLVAFFSLLYICVVYIVRVELAHM